MSQKDIAVVAVRARDRVSARHRRLLGQQAAALQVQAVQELNSPKLGRPVSPIRHRIVILMSTALAARQVRVVLE